VSGAGNVDLTARPPVMVATVDGFLFVTRTCLAAEAGSERAGMRLCGPPSGGLAALRGQYASDYSEPITVSIFAGSGS